MQTPVQWITFLSNQSVFFFIDIALIMWWSVLLENKYALKKMDTNFDSRGMNDKEKLTRQKLLLRKRLGIGHRGRPRLQSTNDELFEEEDLVVSSRAESVAKQVQMLVFRKTLN